MTGAVHVTPAAGGRAADHEHSGLRAWPLRRTPLTIIVGGLVVLFAICAAGGLFLDRVLDNTWVTRADERVPQWFEDHRTSAWNSLTYWGSMLADTYVKVGLIAIVGLTMIVAYRRWYDALLLAGSVIIEATVFLFASLAVQRPRPDVEQLDHIPPTGSFPSGHAAAATAFYAAFAVVVCWHTRRPSIRRSVIALAVAAPLIVGVSRIQRGMHHPIDVAAGILLGLCSVALMYKALRVGARRIDEQVRAGALDVPDRARRLDVMTPTSCADLGATT